MDDLRSAFVEAAASAVQLLRQPEISMRWNEASILPGFTVSGLAGHLLRGIKSVETYLEGPNPGGEPIGAANYYVAIGITADISSPLNSDVRSRGEKEATLGSEAVADEAQALLQRLRPRLAAEPVDRRLQVLDSLIITLDEYLRTRVVELVIHCEDLAHSVDRANVAQVTPSVATVAIGTLVDLARFRHGDAAVLRALARRERDAVDALRVL